MENMNELVRTLSSGDHPVEASVGREKTVENLKSAIDRGMCPFGLPAHEGGQT
jgi:hypothetical protein